MNSEPLTAADILAVYVKGIIGGWKVANPLDIHTHDSVQGEQP